MMLYVQDVSSGLTLLKNNHCKFFMKEMLSTPQGYTQSILARNADYFTANTKSDDKAIPSKWIEYCAYFAVIKTGVLEF